MLQETWPNIFELLDRVHKLLQNILFILNLYHKDKGQCLICLRHHKYIFERNLENIRPILVNNLLERGRTTSVENGSKMVIGQTIKLINQWNRENTKSVCFKIWRYIWIHKIEDGEMNSIHCVKFTNYSFIIIFKKKWTYIQDAIGWCTASNTTRTINCYPFWELYV